MIHEDELLYAAIICRRFPVDRWLLNDDVLSGFLWATCPRLPLHDCREIIADVRGLLFPERRAA